MKNTKYSYEYIEKVGGVIYKREIMHQIQRESIILWRRDYYKKRNGKSCYIDFPFKRIKLEKDQIKIKKRHYSFSNGESDWNPVNYTIEKYKINEELKKQLILNYIKELKINTF